MDQMPGLLFRYRKGMLSAFVLFATMAMSPDDAARAASGGRSGQQVVQFQCVLCHGAGMSGAPRIGDRKAWEKRLSAGEERLLRSATDGRGAMPPNGGLSDLTPQELRAAIDYMIKSSGAK
jgi:cytochrome c5